MDTVALLIIAAAVAGVAWLVFFRKEDDSSSASSPAVAPAPVKSPASENTTLKAAKVSVPAGADKMTKAQIEAEARAQGVELDKRKTKANMLSEWKQAIK
ncbi:MAG: hypothetical protein GY886_10585 [Gammaproteobacteria bacterium]|nr:hypothetical protein [Gammaproteobacteria bacterium]